jgi:hypothetical protein
MRLISFIFISILFIRCSPYRSQTEIKILANYPSASAIEYFDNAFYIIGDDATSILILDNDLAIKDSIQLYNSNEYRLPKPTKPDLESMTVFHTTAGYRLLVLGSGSLPPYRNTGWLIDPKTKQATNFRLDTLYQHLISLSGIREVNIEGICTLPGGLLLVSRGHQSYPENNLLFIDSSFYFNLNNAVARRIKIERPLTDTSAFSGISGLSYSTKTDRLFLTLSTELTSSTYTDGPIGKSYLWIINNFSEKLNVDKVLPDKIIELDKIDAGFKNQKIESVCIIAERKNETQLAMVADNDNGTSTLFKLAIEIN